jgi:hypothetical protein
MKNLIIIVFLFFGLITTGQDNDSTTVDSVGNPMPAEKYHSPSKAALLSLIPGGGQIYNKSYWKIPIIYGGLILFTGFAIKNNNIYQEYKDEAINRFNNDTTINFPDLSDNQVLDNKDFYERKRNLNILIAVGVYILNIVDASVDAHFFEYDISPDLSLRAEPFIRPPDNYATTLPTAGITLTLKL